VLSAVDELTTYRDLDTVLRRAVELSRESLGLVRAALFLYDEPGDRLCGTWGTGLDGETVDEHHMFFTAGLHQREATAQAMAGVARWMVFADAPLLMSVEGRPQVFGRGWNVTTPILGRSGPLGLFTNDPGRTRRELQEDTQERLAIFCRILGYIIEDLRQRAQALPWPSLLARTPAVGDTAADPLTLSVVRALHQDPTLTGEALAKRFAVSPSKLTQAFKQEMGVSLVEYRNRLRLERFLHLVAPGGGNLMDAASQAGFGSYAQFHRVSCELLGASPREYLARRER
jgi:AraC-like DNA-binding protein